MSETKEKGTRLSKVMKEFNIGNDTIVSFLKGKGHVISDDITTSKLTAEQYDLVVREFATDRKLKERAETLKGVVKEVKNAIKAPETEKEKEKEKEREKEKAKQDVQPASILSAEELRSNMNDKAEAKAEQETQVQVVEEEKPSDEQTTKPSLKVVGSIDLNQIGKKGKAKTEEEKPKKGKKAEIEEEKPKKGKKKTEEVQQVDLFSQPVVEEEKATEQIAAQQTETQVVQEEEKVESVIRASDNTPKLGGLKVVGKIELPNQQQQQQQGQRRDQAAEDAKQKRKRKTTQSPIQANTFGTDAKKGGKGGQKNNNNTNNNSQNNNRPQRTETNQREVSDNIRSTLADMNKRAGRGRQKFRRDKRDVAAAKREQREQQILADSNVLEVTEFLTANELAQLMNISVNQVIAKCMALGMFVSINQRIDADVIQLIAEEFGFEVRFVSADEQFEVEEEEEEDDNLHHRPPIVTVMGHVDHGKTSLLDYVRKANVIAGEAGGITQHIGAYNVELADGRQITFLDTPGHEAFTAMRARGAQVTDVAIIVIAADDQVMPQTREAINHAQAANVPMVFAINKIDKPGAQAEKIREQLAQMNLLVEQWGGKYQCQEISAKQGVGIHELLDKVLLEADMLDLKANPDKLARGTVIEAQLDKGRGVVVTMLVQNGTMRVGDVVIANNHYGRVKAMTDERGNRVKEAGPAMPVQILGLDGVPQAGDKFQVMENERDARELATKRQQLLREQSIRMQKHITLEEIARRAALGDFRELNLIVKGDVDGSVEALSDSLLKLSEGEVAVNIIMKGVGQITESDVLLASASNAMIVAFQVRPSSAARRLAEAEQIDIRTYSIIYDAINEIKDALEGLLAPKVQEEIMGSAEVRDVFRISKVGSVAGCMVTEGKIARAHQVRLIRDGVVVYTGKVLALKRFKDDVREVAQGYECGISIENFNDIKPGDVIEAFTTIEVKRTLA